VTRERCGQTRTEREAVVCKSNCRSKDPLTRQSTEAGVCLAQCGNSPWNARCASSVDRKNSGETGRRLGRTVDRCRSPVLRDEQESVAAETAGVRQEDTESRGGRDRGVHRVSTLGVRGGSHLSRDGMAAGDDAARPMHEPTLALLHLKDRGPSRFRLP
jgi:hypothetical protein